MTLGQFHAMMAEQNGRCAICDQEFGVGRRLGPNVDHNHRTGKVRSLLCVGCNAGLGNFKESIQVMRLAINYLERKESDGKSL